jgi:uncharacterized protein (DUF2126 family)
MSGARHIMSCNGGACRCIRLDGRANMSPASVSAVAAGEQSCIRRSLWHARSCFDLVDTWNDRPLGGCVYHVAHPADETSRTFPVNSYEAEGRRLARFSTSSTRQVWCTCRPRIAIPTSR